MRSTQCSNTLPHTLTDFSTLSSSNTPLTTLVEHLLQWATPQLGLVFIGRDSRRRAHTGWEVIDAELFTRRDSASAWHRAKVCARTMMLQGLSTSEGSEEGEESKEGEESEESKEGEVRLGEQVVPERGSVAWIFLIGKRVEKNRSIYEYHGPMSQLKLDACQVHINCDSVYWWTPHQIPIPAHSHMRVITAITARSRTHTQPHTPKSHTQ